MNLRDHDDDCDHGWSISHWPVDDYGDPIGDDICPGGAVVVLDFEAAGSTVMKALTFDWEQWAAESPDVVLRFGHDVVDAAFSSKTKRSIARRVSSDARAKWLAQEAGL